MLIHLSLITMISWMIRLIIKDFTVGSGGDVLDLSALHSASLAAGFGDSWSGTTWAYSHGYIQFAIEGEDTLVNYDQDGWYDSHSTTTIARLEGVNLASLICGQRRAGPQ